MNLKREGNTISGQIMSDTGNIIPNAKFVKSLSGEISSPQEEEWVLYCKTEESQYYILGVINNHTEDLGDFTRTSVDQYTLNFDDNNKIEIQENNGEYTININFEGDVTINSENGNILIGDKDEAVPVAKQDHTHTDSEGGQTSEPNEDGTEVLIE